MGNDNKDFSHKLLLRSKDALQIRHNALEAARKNCNRVLEEELGTENYKLRLRVYPHHILRENPMATGAGADRMSEGMSRAFGKPVGLAAQIDEGQILMEARVDEEDIEVGKEALRQFIYKVPCSGHIDVED